MNTNDLRDPVCEREGDMVAYLYAEATPVQRAEFESHLLGCTVCTDEFAEMSGARYSVYEWQREEFAPLATPRFAIPYEVPKPSFVQALRSKLSFGWASYAVAAAVLVVTLGGFGFWNMMTAPDLRANGSNKVVRDQETPAISAAVSTPETVASPDTLATAFKNDKEVQTAPSTVAVQASVRERPARTTRSTRSPVRRVVPTAEVASDIRSGRPLPTLTASVEDEDGSLRLTDLFDSLGREL